MADLGSGERNSQTENSVRVMLETLQAEVRGIARTRLNGERAGHTLQATALANEAFLRLIKQKNLQRASQAEFLAAASQTIRRILVDRARAKTALKRHGKRVSLSGVEPAVDDPNLRFLALNEVLEKLRQYSLREYQVVMLRYFSGMSEGETSEALRVPRRTISRDWSHARAWLKRELSKSE